MDLNNLSVKNAFKLIWEIQKRCPDIAMKVITVDDIYDTLGLSEWDHPEEVEKELKEVIRTSWEFKTWPGIGDHEWESVYEIDGIQTVLEKHGIET